LRKQKRGEMFFKDKKKEGYSEEQEAVRDKDDFIPSGDLGADEEEDYETSKSYEEEQTDSSSGMSGGFSADSGEGYNAGSANSLRPSSNFIRRSFDSSVQNVPSAAPSSSVLSESPDAIVQEFRKMDEKINSIVDWIKEFYERFSPAIDGLSRMRRIVSENEESINQALKDSARAIELTSKIDLEKLRMDAKKLDMEAEANKQEIARLSGEIENLNERAAIFVSTEELLKLNEEVKKGLLQMKSMESEIRGRADRIERMRKESSTNISLEFRKQMEGFESLIQKTAVLTKQNREAIGNFTFEDYQEKTDTILEVIEKLAGEVSIVKKELNKVKEESESQSLAKKNEAIQALENIGAIPELPELPTPKIKKVKKSKKKK